MLAVFAAVSRLGTALDLWQVVVNGRVWTGTDGLFLVDQMQYLAWIRDAAHHLAVSNLFVLRSTAADYFQPAMMISAACRRLVSPPWLSLLLWKPVAVGAAFLGVPGVCLPQPYRTCARRAALLLALFFGSFSDRLRELGFVGDLFPASGPGAIRSG